VRKAFTHVTAAVTAAAAMHVFGGCAPATTEATESVVGTSDATNWAEGPIESPTSLTGEQFCATLSSADIAPLTQGEVTDAPTPTDDRGLPGCKWPVRDGYGWLDIAVFKPFDVDILLDARLVADQYPLSNGTMYLTTKEPISMCRSVVRTPATPDGFLLSVAVDGPVDATVNACKTAIPQAEKVLHALGW
jgi:hypothetical protein